MRAVLEEPFAAAGLIRALRARRRRRAKDPTRALAEHILGECVHPLLLEPDPARLRARSAQILPLFAHHRAALLQLLEPLLASPAGPLKVLAEVRRLLEDGVSHPPPCLDADGALAFRFGIATTFRAQRRFIDRVRRGTARLGGAESARGLEPLWS